MKNNKQKHIELKNLLNKYKNMSNVEKVMLRTSEVPRVNNSLVLAAKKNKKY